MMAAEEGYTHTVEVLVEGGADIDTQDLVSLSGHSTAQHYIESYCPLFTIIICTTITGWLYTFNARYSWEPLRDSQCSGSTWS